MHNRLLTTAVSALALGAFAVLPATASASPELINDQPTPEQVPAGSEMRLESSNLVFSAAPGNIECSNGAFSGEVATNSGTEVAAEISKASLVGPELPAGIACKTTIMPMKVALTAVVTPGQLPWCLKFVGGTDEWTLRGAKCSGSSTAFSFLVELYESGSLQAVCRFDRASMSGVYKTKTTPLTLTVNAKQVFNKAFGSTLCPGAYTLSGSLAFTSSTGTKTSIQ